MPVLEGHTRDDGICHASETRSHSHRQSHRHRHTTMSHADAACRRQRMEFRTIGALVGCQAIGVLRIQGEVVAAVLKGEATPPRDEPRAEAHVVGVDKGTCIALAVHNLEADGVAAGYRRPLHNIHRRLVDPHIHATHTH